MVRTVFKLSGTLDRAISGKLGKSRKFAERSRIAPQTPAGGIKPQVWLQFRPARNPIPYTTIARCLQGKYSTNLFTLFDFGHLCLDNSRWSVRMKSNPFRTAQTVSKLSVPKLSAGVLLMGLALSASARDAGDAIQRPASIQGKAPQQKGKATHKARRWYQVGIASWYGSYFQGRKTADGERFDMNRMTCAHPTLPMGTWLRVTNLKNRQSTFVRVNDRGPVVEGRIVDLSAAAARVLGLSGVGKVRLEAVRPSDPELAMAMVSQLRVPSMLQIQNR